MTPPRCRPLAESLSLALWSGPLLRSRRVDVLGPRRSLSLPPLARHLSCLCWWRRWHVSPPERPALEVRPFGRVPKIRRRHLRCAPSPAADLSVFRGQSTERRTGGHIANFLKLPMIQDYHLLLKAVDHGSGRFVFVTCVSCRPLQFFIKPLLFAYKATFSVGRLFSQS